MNKLVKISLKILGALIVLALLFYFVVGPIMRTNTKKHSPEVVETYDNNATNIEVFYCSPSKKGRTIFGELVPYGEVWRTGANEASTFTTNKDLTINGNVLPAGKYTLWTIPGEDSWQVIFNKKMYGWGVRFQDGKAMREADHDALVATATVSQSITVQESFSINVLETSSSDLVLMFAWDNVTVPLSMKVN
ncbi:DUF2911 domain-containing protein [Aureisphaera galaxeae]|uniref:DUF2911 domain-containing protein n=1 Tax=Aureisphaera galaxeae TaxID=1538023 RepID=UPI00234FD14A|nr:DUF2911 domain-containing protein [Aureisphaera galaxeae]MDC8006255.1 DUF2911 domain-containing protein [Aureisphaera galaxeae]